jgi:hypothetical protein
MDREELQKQRVEEERIRLQKEEEEKKQVEWEKRMKRRLEAVDSLDLSGGSAWDMELKLAKLNALFPRDGESGEAVTDNNLQDLCDNIEQTVHIGDNEDLPPPIPIEAMNDQDLTLFYSTDATQQLKSHGATPMFPDPPSYSDLFLDSLKTTTESTPTTPTAPKPPTRQLRLDSANQFDTLSSAKRIEIIHLSTYQGRLSRNPEYDSTNGCTVISPLIVATHIHPRHYQTNAKQYAYGISNTEIKEIIDKRSPKILNAVRTKCGLSQHALIVPSDVHDYLVDEGILPQELFVGVCGGDILEVGHVRVLMDMIESGRGDGDGRLKKVGVGECVRNELCCFYFLL